MPDLDEALVTAMQAADHAVEHVLHHRPATITAKGDRDLVTDVDLAVERLVRDLLRAWNPNVGFLGEETGAVGDKGTYWVLDPIDGTVNFAHGSPLCAIALALVHDHQPVLGVTMLPFLRRRYWAARDRGAFRDNEPITVASSRRLDEALIGICDYGSGPDAAVRDRLCGHLDRQLTARAQGVRRLGTTALDLVWLADGTLDAAILFGNRVWDTAAGTIIAREAGALVLDADGSQHSALSRSTLATTPALADTLLPLMEVARGTTYWPAHADRTE